MSYNIWIVVTLLLEKLKNKSNPNIRLLGSILHGISIGLLLYVPTMLVWIKNDEIHPLSGVITITILVIVFMKLYSYIMINSYHRFKKIDVKVELLGIIFH
jgi:hypothetical protein